MAGESRSQGTESRGLSPHVSGFAETVPQINALFGGRWLGKRSRLWVREKPGNMRAVPGFFPHRHKVKMTLAGYADWTGEITVEARKSATVVGELQQR